MENKVVDTDAYVTVLKNLVEEGQEVSLRITGCSMTPFLGHGRDDIFFRRPERPLRRGDMVFYRRSSGQYVMHRICRVTEKGYDLVGDAQTRIEHGIRQEQIFALVTRVRRKGKLLGPGDFLWEFFARIWIRMIPLRPGVMKCYGFFRRR